MMPRKCCVPNCKSGYDSTSTPGEPKPRIFGGPVDPELQKKWEQRIPRADYVVTPKSYICQNHFLDDDIIKTSTSSSGLVKDLVCWRLKDGAIPTLFPSTLTIQFAQYSKLIFTFSIECPSYLSFKAKAERKSVTSSRTSPYTKPVKPDKDKKATIVKENNNTGIETPMPITEPLPLAILPVQFGGFQLGALHNEDGLMDIDEPVTPTEIDFSLQLSKLVLPTGWTSTKCDYFLADSRYKPGSPLLINLCFDGGKLKMKKAILVDGCSLIYYVLGEPFRGKL